MQPVRVHEVWTYSPYFPPGWMRFKDKCFMFKGKKDDIKANWSYARSWCKDQGGELAVIDDQYENGERNVWELKQSSESRYKRLSAIVWSSPVLQTLCPATWEIYTSPRGSACRISCWRISTPGVTGSALCCTPTGTTRSPTTQEEQWGYFTDTTELCMIIRAGQQQ